MALETTGAGQAFPLVADRDRVRRLVALPQVKPAMVDRLAASTVALVGVGGLGSASGPYLAAAGVGRLILIDPGVVSATDLGRQILYTAADVGLPKVDVAARALSAQNPALHVTTERMALTVDNLAELLANCDVVVDGLDNGPPRDWLNAFAVQGHTPVVFGGALGYEGQVMVVPPGGRPCLACLFGTVADAPGECSVDGVLGPLVGIVGSLEAAEVMKLLLGVGAPLTGRMWMMDLFTGATRVLTVPARPDCPVCGLSAGSLQTKD